MQHIEYKEVRRTIGTQREVADLLGVRLNTVSRRELGYIQITREAELALLYVAEKTKKEKRHG